MQEPTSVPRQVTIGQVAAIKQNNEPALKALYQENYPKVEAYVLQNNGTAEEAKDIYQEAFIAVWRNVQADRFTPVNGRSLAGYLYQVAKYKWLDHLRSAQHRYNVPLPHTESGYTIADEVSSDDEEYLAAVRNNFDKLGETCREVLTRFYYGRQPLRTIATAFNWTEATAKNNKYRCLQRLRELIKN